MNVVKFEEIEFRLTRIQNFYNLKSLEKARNFVKTTQIGSRNSTV